MVKAWIEFALYKTLPRKETMQDIVPFSWRLVKSVECFLKLPFVVFVAACVAFWLIHKDFLLQNAVEECTRHVVVEQGLALVSSDCREQTDGFKLSYGGKSLVVVLAISLQVSFGNKPCFELDDRAALIKFLFESV